MTNALTIYTEFDNLQRAALALQKSGYFTDVKSEAQAIVKVMAGAELGLPPFASMTGIHIIQGKPVLGANVLATLVKNDPRYDYRVKVANDDACLLEWLEDGHKVGEAGFTMEEAKAAGLTNKDNWKKYPSDMLFARAIGRGARRFAPGIFGGSPVYTPDEMGADVDAEGYVDAVEVKDVTETAKKTPDEIAAELGFTKPEPDPEPENGKAGLDAVYQAIVDAGLSENTHAAANALRNHCKTGYNTPEKALAWMRKYRAAKDEGKNTIEAAEVANA